MSEDKTDQPDLALVMKQSKKTVILRIIKTKMKT